MRIASTVLAFALTLAACGGPLKLALRGSELSPGSDAQVVAAIDDGRHVTDLEITATNLTPADRLLPSGKAYVVWQRKDDKTAWARAGALELENEGRNGKAKLTVPETAFDMLVSVEADASVASPSGKTVFSQRVEKK